MELNPYELPQQLGYKPPKPSKPPRRRKPLVGYPIAALAGGITGGMALTPFMAPLDDAGGTEFLVGAIVGVAMYAML